MTRVLRAISFTGKSPAQPWRAYLPPPFFSKLTDWSDHILSSKAALIFEDFSGWLKYWRFQLPRKVNWYDAWPPGSIPPMTYQGIKKKIISKCGYTPACSPRIFRFGLSPTRKSSTAPGDAAPRSSWRSAFAGRALQLRPRRLSGLILRDEAPCRSFSEHIAINIQSRGVRDRSAPPPPPTHLSSPLSNSQVIIQRG